MGPLQISLRSPAMPHRRRYGHTITRPSAVGPFYPGRLHGWRPSCLWEKETELSSLEYDTERRLG